MPKQSLSTTSPNKAKPSPSTLISKKGRKYKKRPTLKQRRAIQIFTENLGNPNITMGEIMRMAGYSKVTSLSPENLTESKGWEVLVEKYLPDDLLLQANKKLLEAKRIKRTYIKGDLQEETEEEDTYAIANGLKLGYQVKGKLINQHELKGKLSLTSLIENHG